MQRQENYDVSLEEIHHTEKKDAPSGTAITLAEEIIAISPQKKRWLLRQAQDEVRQTNDDQAELKNTAELIITSKRIDPAAGTHSVHYTSGVDDIEIIHTAHNRKGFAAGALLAAEYIYDKKGIFNMQDVLQF